jgi:hypothetical protein
LSLDISSFPEQRSNDLITDSKPRHLDNRSRGTDAVACVPHEGQIAIAAVKPCGDLSGFGFVRRANKQEDNRMQNNCFPAAVHIRGFDGLPKRFSDY